MRTILQKFFIVMDKEFREQIEGEVVFLSLIRLS